MPGGQGSLSIDEKTAILIKSYELEPLPKLALETGERATKELLHSGQYLGSLLRPKNLYWILGRDRVVELLDTQTARIIRDDPVYGFSHYIVDHGVANVFGRQVFEGKMPLEPAIGAASAIGIVERGMDGKTDVYTKKQLGIETRPLREVAKQFHSTGEEKQKPKIIEQQKEPFEIAKEELEKRQQEEEEIQEELDLGWLKEDAQRKLMDSHELKKDESPELIGETEVIEPEPIEEKLAVPFFIQKEPQEQQAPVIEQEEDEEEYGLPF